MPLKKDHHKCRYCDKVFKGKNKNDYTFCSPKCKWDDNHYYWEKGKKVISMKYVKLNSKS